MAPGRRRRDDVASITIVAIFVYIYYIVDWKAIALLQRQRPHSLSKYIVVFRTKRRLFRHSEP
jgi:ribosome biogenesis protein Nip4